MKAYSLTTEETAGGEIMKKATRTILKRAAWLMVVFLVLLLGQIPVQAATNCTITTTDVNNAPIVVLDTDCDGFSDTEEASPIAGVTTDPATPDLFVIYQPVASGSLMPSATEALSTLTAAAPGIGFNVRQINGPVSPVRNVTSTQRAVKVAESLYVGTNLGDSPQGTPNSTPETGASIVYTKKITNTVAAQCTPPKGKAVACTVAGDTTTNWPSLTQPAQQQAVVGKYIKHTIAHEAAHQMNLKYTCDSSIGCHYPTIAADGTPSVMDQSVFFVKGNSGVSWYIGSQFNAADNNYQLR